MAAHRAAAAGEVTSAAGIAATQTALRRVFDRFTLHRVDAPRHPAAFDAELMVGASYVTERASLMTLGWARCPPEPRWLLARRWRWHRTTHARAAEPAVAVRVRLEVLLVVVLGVVERAGLRYLRRDRSVAGA